MITEQLAIIQLFSGEIDRELTINQIAKLLHKSYAFTNKYVHELLVLGVLTKKTVGNAILCTLNLASERTRALLVFDMIERKLHFESARSVTDKVQLQKFTLQIQQSDLSAIILLSANKLIVYSSLDNAHASASHPSRVAGFPVHYHSRRQFSTHALLFDYRSLVVLYNTELFWLLYCGMKHVVLPMEVA